MRTTAWTAALLLALAPALQAQDTGPIPAFELGVYGGGAWTGDWLGINDEFTGLVGDDDDLGSGFGFGFAPAFGATSTFYASPAFGIRLHGAYMPSDFPTRGEDGVAAFGALGPAVTAIDLFAEDDYDYPLNNWMTDLSLVLRPWIGSRGGWLGSTYLFLGGGLMITDVSGDADPGDVVVADGVDCVDAYQAIGACLSYDPDYATVGQGTAGFGFNLIPLGSRLGIFAEFAAHAYDSPFHTPDEDDALFDTTLAEDRFAWTGRASLGLKLALGDLAPEQVVAPPVTAPVPVPTPAPAPAPTPPPAPVERPITVCVVQGTTVASVDAIYLPAEQDTLVVVQGVRRPFTEAYPAVAPDYAAGAGWYVNTDALQFNQREFVKFGVPRLITQPSQLVRVGEYQGVGLFAETGATAPYQVLYVPLRPGCEFQPYSPRPRVRG